MIKYFKSECTDEAKSDLLGISQSEEITVAVDMTKVVLYYNNDDHDKGIDGVTVMMQGGGEIWLAVSFDDFDREMKFA